MEPAEERDAASNEFGSIFTIQSVVSEQSDPKKSVFMSLYTWKNLQTKLGLNYTKEV